MKVKTACDDLLQGQVIHVSAKAGFGDEHLKGETHQVNELNQSQWRPEENKFSHFT